MERKSPSLLSEKQLDGGLVTQCFASKIQMELNRKENRAISRGTCSYVRRLVLFGADMIRDR